MQPTRREFLLTTPLAANAFAQQRASRPNVVILLTDDQGYGDLSCHGNPVLKTPNLDRLHSESVRFTDFHVAPMCTPTRGQLLTGLDALHNGATSVTAGRAIVRRGIPTMADIFSANGYATGIFGKWHIGDCYPYRPMDRGFQVAKYHRGFGISSAVEFGNDYFNGRYLDNGVSKQFPGYCTDFWFSEAMNFMRQQKQRNQPFLCYLPTNTPHGPAWVDEKYAAPYRKEKQPADFFGMIANLDENVGKLEAFLKDSGLRENTIFIYMTDNGGTAGVPVFNAGMRARKTAIYDGGHRVPCFVRWPAGRLSKPADVNVPAQIQDVLPTLIDLCGLKNNAKFDGTSLAPLLKNTSARLPDRMMVVQYGQILKKWESCVINGKWRLINGEELFDFHAEPGESTDLSGQHRDIVKQMRDHYEAWWARVEPALREYVPISIGAPQSNPVSLCCADWHDIYSDNPGHVANGAGGPQGGPWSVFIERDGEYQVTLSRWPFHLELALDAPCPPIKLTRGSLPEGKAFPIAAAKMTIAGQTLSAKAPAGSKSVTLAVKLKGNQKTDLQAWFQDKNGKDLCGAFYASVKRI